jgi:hypothetical protein
MVGTSNKSVPEIPIDKRAEVENPAEMIFQFSSHVFRLTCQRPQENVASVYMPPW